GSTASAEVVSSCAVAVSSAGAGPPSEVTAGVTVSPPAPPPPPAQAASRSAEARTAPAASGVEDLMGRSPSVPGRGPYSDPSRLAYLVGDRRRCSLNGLLNALP